MAAVRWQIGIAALMTALSLAGCVRTPPEQRLRDTVAALQAAIAAREVGEMKQILAEDFVGSDGLDREGAARLAQVMFLRHRDVGVSLGPLEVELHERHATVRFNAALTGGSGAPLPDAARLYDVETGWRLEGNEWHLTSASWTPRF